MSYRENNNQLFIFLRFLEELITSYKMGLVSHVVTLGLGVYTGIYLSQNYDIAKVDEPQVVIDKVKNYLETILKPKP
ncbi:uncharacterized protein LOC112682519 [Sipha flava]|uniref:Uncharacterized protein LOC112682519 n=1 Tax=Sipha flava TaxID=143950 RepID=A0A8B8FEZ6_9HEMI|nr:uncharacterized protein LOC112682519 [Sipha flava]